jgi:hypothetical protein
VKNGIEREANRMNCRGLYGLSREDVINAFVTSLMGGWERVVWMVAG